MTSQGPDAIRVLKVDCAECYEVPVYEDYSVHGRVAVVEVWFDFAEIHYDPSAMEWLGQKYGDSVPFFIFGHEYGHYIDHRTNGGWSPDPWVSEEVADSWGGCALARVGMPLEPTEMAMREFLSPKPTDTHPPFPMRIEAVRAGAQRCSQ